MSRAIFLLVPFLLVTSFGTVAPSPSWAQSTAVKSSQEVAPELIEARAQAENDLKQVHLLARYPSSGHTVAPQDLASIDSQYDDLAASVNGYLQGFAAAVQLPEPLDDAKWKDRGNAVLAQAATFDDSMKKLRAANAGASGTRGSFVLGVVSILAQILIPGATGYQKIKGDADASSLAQRKQIADVFLTAVWRDSTTVLAPATATATAKKDAAPAAAASPR